MTHVLTETLEALVLQLRRNRDSAAGSIVLALARDPRAPVDVVIELLESSDPYVRVELVWHPGLPAWALQRLCADETSIVSEVARERARELGWDG